MLSLFESFNTLNRGWGDRVLEFRSVRTVFLWLLASLFVLGAYVSIAIYQSFRFHRFDWADVLLIALFGIPCFRYARIVFRRLVN